VAKHTLPMTGAPIAKKSAGSPPVTLPSEANVASKQSLSITDNRTGKTYEVPVKDGTIHATDLRQIKTDPEDFGLMSYDPAFNNTASCRSAVTFIDGDKGILRYRGYPIEQLAEKGTFLETAYLIIHGELPTKTQLGQWTYDITHHTFIHENIKKLMDGFRYDAHPMGVFVSTVAALSTFYPEANQVRHADVRYRQILRLIAKTPTLAAFAYRHSIGMPYAYPDNDLSYPGNTLNMMFKTTEAKYQPNKVLERALDVLFILHADHEQNCSANAMRSVGSSEVDPYSAMAAAAAALYGPLHGGANEQVLRMLREIGGLKNYDPRAKIIKQVADEVFEVTGKNPLLEMALELERIALQDDYFVSHKLYPNVDFYSGIIYEAMKFPVAMFPVLFAIGRTPGWLAQWHELLMDPEQKIARPRQVYVGSDTRDYVAIEKRR